MYNDKTTAKERMSKKGNAIHRALNSKIDKTHIKQNIKAAHKRIKKDGVDFDKA